MRVALLLGLLLVTPSVGHAAFPLFFSSSELGSLTTREQVRAHFGRRLTSGFADGRPYDEVRYRGEVSPEDRMLEGEGRAILMLSTCGLSELIIFLPRDALRASRDVLVGHSVRFEYDAWDRVITWRVDGEILHQVELPPPAGSSPTQP
jgi:hypothetical protein